jgi:hypothetical protein
MGMQGARIMKRATVLILALFGMAGCGGGAEPGDSAPRETGGVRIPLVIKGRLYTPEEVHRLYRGRLLHLFVDDEAFEGRFAYAFDSAEDEQQFLARWEAAHPQRGPGDVSDSIFYEDIDGHGARLVVPASTAVEDLGHVHCFLWWCGRWDDRISSVTPSRRNRYTVLYEHVNYGASSDGGVLKLAYDPHRGFLNLTDLGFNDRASSISYEY